MKKILLITFISAAMMVAFCGCGSTSTTSEEPSYEDEYTYEEDYGCEGDWEDTSPIPGLVEDALGEGYDTIPREEYEASVDGFTDPEDIQMLVNMFGEENIYQGADGAWYIDPYLYYNYAESYEAGSNEQEALDIMQQVINDLEEVDPRTECPDCGEKLGSDGYCGECEIQWHRGADGTWQ